MIASSILLYALIPQAQAGPNHLEPIAPYDFLGIGYDQAVFTSLIGKGWVSLWMIEMPSFSQKYAVVLRHRYEYDPNDTRPVGQRVIKGEQWITEHVTYVRKRIDNRHETLDVRPTGDIERHSTRVTQDFAKALQEAWLSTLILTRYAEDRRGGVDGTTLQFYCGDLFGQTWSPNAGLPAMLADLGRKLRTLALSDEKGKESLLAEADTLARKITREAEAEQIKVFGKKMSPFWWNNLPDRIDHRPQTVEAR